MNNGEGLLILCGFACAGKSTIGQLCASRLSYDFYDTDRMMESDYGGNKRIGEIWKEIGNDAFRALENKIIYSLHMTQGIVALGGGSLICEKNRKFLQQRAVFIYLKASIETLFERISHRGFPDYLDKKNPFDHLKKIFLERSPIYQESCDYILNTEQATPDEIADKICRNWK